MKFVVEKLSKSFDKKGLDGRRPYLRYRRMHFGL